MAPDPEPPRSMLSADLDALLTAVGAAAATSDLGREYRMLRQIVDGAAAAVAILDPDLRYRYVNPYMARMNGLPAASHIGHTMDEVLPGLHRSEEVLRQVLRDGEPRELIATGYRWARSPHARREWRATYHRLVSERGEVVGVAGIGLEIAEPRRYLHELEYAHQRMTLLDTAANQIGTTLDVDTTCGELTGFVVPSLADAACVELFSSERAGRQRLDAGRPTGLRRVAFRAAAPLTERLGDLATPGVFEEYVRAAPLRRRLEQGRFWLYDLRGPDAGDGGPGCVDRVARCRAAGIRSAVVVPLASDARLLGALTLVRGDSSPVFTRQDAVVAQDLAARAARALSRAVHYDREHTMALELQRALLSEPSVPHPNLETASRYLPADDSTLVGGDWFDSLALPGNRNMLVIGDVMGHGVEAAVAMSHYRSMLRAMAINGLPPHQVLSRADQLVSESGFGRVATCLLALGDPRTGTLTYANAGHLPPLRLSTEGVAEIVPVPVGPPLGTGYGRYGSVVRPGVPGAVLLMYTDGLVERRGEDIDVSLDRLTRLRLNPRDPLETILDEALAQLTGGRAAEDDIALLAVRTKGPRPLPDDGGEPV
ncbi:SpoIIE family protein phosphatase [Streptomyces sp. NPDC090306]|uniref:SpoIIE family protein phosphatase n=1 Tax=Streptomyces sp. NPDC090306 TaxID=3365961 RepID=UPI0038066C02